MHRTIALAGLVASLLIAGPALGQSAEELARAAQNPVASLISVPFQNNTNFNVGPDEETQNVLNIQPVNIQASAYYNVETPEYGADWQLRLQLQLMFPK
jgi:hypothetical protein